MGFSWTLFLCINSPGVSLHDEIGHYLISQNAWNYPELMLDLWGRSLNTIFYMIPAKWGLTIARFLSLIVAALIVLLTTRVAKISGVERLYLVPLMLWFQPWFNGFSYQVITEVPFSLTMIMGVLLWLKGRENAAAIFFGLLPLIRHEGIALSGLYFLYMFYHRKWKSGLLTFLSLAGYNLIYFAVLNDWPFHIFLDAEPTDLYGSGSWFHYFPRLSYRAGLPVVLMALIALSFVWRERRRFLYLVGYIAYFMVHVLIYRFGLFASGGYIIFLLPIAPALAIVAALGGERVLNYLEEFPKRSGFLSSRRLRQAFVFMGVILILITGFTSRPIPLDEEGFAMREAAEWIRENGYTERRIATCHVWFVYFYELPWVPGERWDEPVDLAHLPTGSLVVWDRKYCEPWGVHLSYLSDPQNGWQKLKDFRGGVAILFQRN